MTVAAAVPLNATGIEAGNVAVVPMVKLDVMARLVNAPLTTPVVILTVMAPVWVQVPERVTVPVIVKSPVPVPEAVEDTTLAPSGMVVLAEMVSAAVFVIVQVPKVVTVEVTVAIPAPVKSTGILAGKVDGLLIKRLEVTERAVSAPLTIPVPPLTDIAPVWAHVPATCSSPVTVRASVPELAAVVVVTLEPIGMIVFALIINAAVFEIAHVPKTKSFGAVTVPVADPLKVVGIVVGKLAVVLIVRLDVTARVVNAPLTTPVVTVTVIDPVCVQVPDRVRVPVTIRAVVPPAAAVVDVTFAPSGSVVLAATVSWPVLDSVQVAKV